MDSIFTKIAKLKKVAGLSLHYVNQSEVLISYCLLSLEKGSIEITDFGSLSTFENLKEKVQDLAVFVNVSGKSIIEKVLNTNSTNNAFPNSSETDFLFQISSNENICIASLIRKDKADKITSQLRENGIYPISLSLGNSVTTNGFQSVSNFDAENFILFNNKISIEDFEIQNIEKTESISDRFLIEDKNLTDSEYFAFSTALNAFYAENSISIPNYLLNEKEDYFHKNIFDKLKIGIPLFFLVILLINFLFYSNYLNKNKELSQGDLQNSFVIEKLDSLRSEVNLKQEFLDQSNWLSQSRVSYYADQIGLLINEDINLKVLDIFPSTLIKKNNTKTYEFKNKTILVEGYSDSLNDLNAWKLELQKQDWIKDVELISYLQESKRKDITFELKISLI